MSALVAAWDWATATVVIVGGQASAAADFGHSFDMAVPPASLSPNVFYDFRDLPGAASGTLGAGGWANVSWNVSGGASGRIGASGGSSEGFNNSYDPQNGWVYGRGHADFTVTFATDTAYLYEVTGTVGNTSGVRLGKGAFRAGTHTITVGSLGTNGGFSFEVNLTQFTGNVLDMFRDSVSVSPTDPGDPAKLYVNFIPKSGLGLTLKEVAELLGVDHFNWTQEITHMPAGWGISMVNPNWKLGDSDQSPDVVAKATFEASGNVVYGAGLNPFGGKIYDPPIDSTSIRYIVTRPGLPPDLLDVAQTGAPGAKDDRPFYWGEDMSRSAQAGNLARHDNHEGSRRLSFSDRATLAEDAPPGQYVGFVLKLVGVSPDGREVALQQPGQPGLGTSVSWQSDAKGVGNVTVFAVDADEVPPSPIGSGGIFGIQLDRANEPPSFTLKLAKPAIVDVSIPVNSQDASQPRTDNAWSVVAPPYPFATNVGIGMVIHPVYPNASFTFALHNHAYLSSQIPDPTQAVVTYELNQPGVVNQLEVIQHANGITRVEGFIGDSLAGLTSIGSVFGPRGDLSGASQFAEGESALFQFTNTVAAKFFRFVIRKTPLANGFALHRAFPRSPEGVRYLGATTDAVPQSLTVNEDAGPQVHLSFAANISVGTTNEALQRVIFVVTNDNAELFHAQPSISANGTLTFTPAQDAYGSVRVTVLAHDDGGVDYGGVDASTPQTFIITIVPVNDSPVPGGDTVIRLNSTDTISALKADLLSNDTDAEGELLNIIAVGNPMPVGASVVIVGDSVVYTAPTTNAGNGSFTYTLNAGSSGHSITGMVTVVESPVLVPVMAVGRSGSGDSLTVIGVSGRSYRVQYSTNMSLPGLWKEFIPPLIFTAPADGVFNYIDDSPQDSMRFYRTIWNP